MNSCKNTALSLLVIFLSFAATLTAQDNELCTGFEDLPAGAVYGERTGYEAGDIFYAFDNIPVSLEAFNYLNGSSDFWNVSVWTDETGWNFGSGKKLFVSNINLRLDFRSLGTTANRVCVRIFDGGGENNFSVNGAPVQIFRSPMRNVDFPVEIAPGVTMTAAYDDPDNDFTGTLCFEGQIETLLIGGQEFAIDDLCYTLSTPPEYCSAEGLEGELTDCSEGGGYELKLALNAGAEAPANASYEVYVANEYIGDFEFENGTVNLSGIPIPDTTAVVAVCESGFVSGESPCCVYTLVERTVMCPPPPDCRIGELIISDVECITPNYFNATIDFEHRGTGETFKIIVGDGIFGEVRYDELPYRLQRIPLPPNPDATETVIGVCDVQSPNCCKRTFVELPCRTVQCEFGALRVSDITCNENGTYNTTLDFNFSGAATRFLLETNGGFREFFEVADLPIRLEGLPRPENTVRDRFFICFPDIIDTEEPCCEDIVFELPCPGPVCDIRDLTVSDIRCNENGSYNATLDFNHASGVQRFVVETGSGFRGEFNLADLPVRLEGLPLTAGARRDKLIVCLPEAATSAALCCDDLIIEVPCSGAGCGIRDLAINEIRCNDDGTYNATLNFNHTSGAQRFLLETEGGFREDFNLADLPIRLEGLPRPEGAARDKFSVCVPLSNSSSELCCGEQGIELPCETAPCEISNLQVVPSACDEEGRYQLRVNFRHNQSEGKFVLGVNDERRGIYRYSDLPLVLGPFAGPLETPLLITVFDQNNPECRARYQVEPFECEPPACELSELQVYDIECRDDGSYAATVDFSHRGAGERFTLHTRGGFRGEFSYAELPLRLENLPLRPTDDGFEFEDVFEICDVSTQGCCLRRPVFLPCDDSRCRFLDLRAEVEDCNEQQFYLRLSFTPQATGSLGYLVFIDGNIFGPFTYETPELRLGPFNADGAEVYDILLIDAVNPTCYAYTEIGPVDCEMGCRISDVRLSSEGCDREGKHRFLLNFNYRQPGNDLFEIFYGEERLGTIPLADLPYRFELQLPDEAPETATFKICINDQPDCCREVSIEIENCFNSNPENDRVWPGDANTDNIANHIDLLPIGLAFGTEGPARRQTGNIWEGLQAENWTASFADGTNYKHADTNGDGVINAADTLAIATNYNRTHGRVQPPVELPTTDLDPPIFVDLPEADDAANGTEFRIPIVLGAEESVVEDIYGVAFTLEFDPEVINPESVRLFYPATWIGEPGVNSITFDSLFAEDGYIEIALTRTDGNVVSGYGPIAYLGGIIDDIAGLHEIRVGIDRAVALNVLGDWIPLQGVETSVDLNDVSDEIGKIDLRRGLRLWPNPARDLLNIHNRAGLPVDWVEIIDPRGRRIGARLLQQSTVPVGNLPEGPYFLRMKIGKYVITERFVKTQ